MKKEVYDVILIGAGVTGSSIAYQLSKKKGNFLVLEEKGDVCEGASKANSGIAHGGYDAEPGSLKAKMNMEGIAMMEEMAKTLAFPYHKIGTFVLCHSEEDRPALEELYQRGLENKTPGMRIVEREELLKMEPNITEEIVAGLYCSEAGVIDPFATTIAFAEQANVNGVDFKFYQKVIGIEEGEEGNWLVRTQNEVYETRAVVNAAGLFSDRIHNMVSKEDDYHILPRKGEYMLLDRDADGIVNHVIFNLPTDKGKGILVSPTIDGNVLLGPTSEFVPSKDQTQTTQERLDYVRESAEHMIKGVPYSLVITSFTGVRAHEKGGDFILEEFKPGFFDCVGVESPGLTSSPAVGIYMANLVQERLQLPDNEDFIAERKGFTKTREMSYEDRQALIKKDPAYGRIICRCESVSEGEILEAIHHPLGAKSLDGIKRRVRATAGRCQAGFCTPRLIELLAREWGVDWDEINKKDLDAYLLTGHVK